MKHPTVILLTLFVLQIYALPHPTITRPSTENKELTGGNVSLESKSTKSETNSISKDIKVEQKSNEITEKGLKSSTSDILENISTDIEQLKIENNEKALTENVRLQSKSSINDDSSSPTKTEKEQKSISENADVEVKGSPNESNNIPTVTKPDPKSSSRPEETPTSRANKDNEELTGAQIETMQQRPPSYYYDMFNIPIAALQAVSSFLGGPPLSQASLTPPMTSRPPVSKEYLRSPIEVLSRSPEQSPPVSDTPASPIKFPNLPGFINQISQIAQTRPGVLLRIPTIQDIINIPISTLNAVSHFLAANYAAQGAPAVSSPPVVAASNVVPSKVPIESTAVINKERLKSGQILETLDNIPDHSTLIGVSEEVASTSNDQVASELYVKQILIANPKYYQDMINIPIVTLKAVSDFLTSVNSDPSLTALPLTPQENKITVNDLSSASLKTSTDVRTDANSIRISGGIPQVPEKSSENSVH